jgi:hypothetical protein
MLRAPLISGNENWRGKLVWVTAGLSPDAPQPAAGRRFPPPWTVEEAQRASRMRPRFCRFQIVPWGLRLLFCLVIDH